MSELKEIKTTDYSTELDEIAKRDTEVFLKAKLVGRRTYGEYEFEPKNGFAVNFGYFIDVLNLDKCEVYQIEQPTLNENQQEWLSRLKAKRKWYGQSSQHAIFSTLLDSSLSEIPEKEFMQVLQVFFAWVLEKEAE